MKGFSHEGQSAVTVEWYTPPWIFERLDIQFDLDPCHPVKCIPWVPARVTYSEINNGLLMPWFGTVWLNPPYGAETKKWLAKMAEHGDGVALVFARTDCAWFHDYIPHADRTLFLKKRVRFVDGTGVTKGSGAGSGSMLVAWGGVGSSALENMRDLGYLV